jgi:2-phosphosulfolactate phosphatase
MLIHIIEGEAGCHFAARNAVAAVVVDALRASATAAALLAHGAVELLVTGTVEEALSLKRQNPDALLYGERGGLPPAGFDYGNSPQEAIHGRHKNIIFTTTTGAGRLLQARGSKPLLMGSTINCSSVVQYLSAENIQEVVIIPAGLMDVPDFDAQEDWAAAAFIAMNLIRSFADKGVLAWGNGYEKFAYYRDRIEMEGLNCLFEKAPHADKLRAVDKTDDILYCAQENLFDAVPVAVKQDRKCVILRNALDSPSKSGVVDG